MTGKQWFTRLLSQKKKKKIVSAVYYLRELSKGLREHTEGETGMFN